MRCTFMGTTQTRQTWRRSERRTLRDAKDGGGGYTQLHTDTGAAERIIRNANVGDDGADEDDKGSAQNNIYKYPKN